MTFQVGSAWQTADAATLYWDSDTSITGNNGNGTGLGGSGAWDLSTSNWWDGAALGLWPNTGADTAIFSAPFGLPPTITTITLSSGITAGQLSFLRSGYVLQGGDLTLAGATPTLSASLGVTATINSQILGTGGLTILGGGTIRLTNAANSFTGVTTISQGILSINSNEALGADSSAIVVTGSATRGFTGGALMLAGGYSSGVTLTRDVSLQGLGPVPAFGAALLSIGNNTITGTLTNGSGALSTGISAAGGRLTLADVTLAGTTGTTFLTVGVGSSLAGVPGIGSYAITGVLSGTGSIQKSGGGTMIVSPADGANYFGTFRLYSGSMRFESVAAFGSNSGVGALSTLDLAGDSSILEVRMDGGTIGKNVYNRAGGSPTFFADHAIGSSVINGTLSFGTLTYDDGENLTFSSRNGYGLAFGATPVITGDGVTTFTNSLTGTLSFTGDFWSDFNNTANRTFTIAGNGNTYIDGSIIATAASYGHSVVKSGTGTLTVTGSASTYTGNTTISAGTLSVGYLGGINGSSTTGSMILGGTTSTGTFEYTGAADTLAKPFSLAGTTGGGAILSDGTGPLTITGSVAASGAGTKTLFLGGTNTGNNVFSGFLMDNTNANTTGLTKIGSGTWVLQEATPALGSAGTVTISAPGTTATNIITLSSGTTAGLVVGQTTSLLASLPQITGILDSTHFTISSTVTTSTAAAGTYNVNAIPTASTSTMGGTWTGPLTLAGGTLKLQATHAASDIVPDANAIILNADYTYNQSAGGTLEFVGVAGQATTETLGTLVPGTGATTVKVTSGAGGTAALTFAALAQSSSTTLSTALNGTGSTTLTLASTAGLAPGMRLLNGSAAAYIVSVTSPTSVIVSATQVSITSGTVLNFGPGNGTVNYVPDAGGSVVFASVPAVGLLSSSSYFKGADFAYAPATVNAILRAPVYGTDAGFVTAGAALTAGSHNLVTGNTSTGLTTVLSLKIDGTSSPTVTQTGLLTIRSGAAGTSGGILVTGGTATLSGTGVTTAGSGDLFIRVDGASDILFLKAPVTSTTTGGLIKTGKGTLVISGANAQTTGGMTQLEEGTIQLATGGKLSANTVNFYMRQDTVFDLNGINVSQTATTSSIGVFSGAGTVTNTSGTAVTFAIAGSGGVFNGTINETNGRISVVKMGTSATQVFNGLSNYTGSTTIGVPGNGTTGTLSAFYLADIDHDSSIGRGDGTSLATNQGSLIFGGTTGGLVYTGTTSASTDRLFTMAGTVATAGATITNNSVNGQALIFSNYNPIAFASANPQLLQLGGTSTSDSWFNPLIGDSGTGANITKLNKLGAGEWILGNTNNSYTGTTTITDGILVAQDGTSLPTASGLILGGTTSVVSVFQTTGVFTRNLADAASAGSNTVSWANTLTTGGSGFAASSDKLIVAIGGLSAPTALTWNVGGFMGTSTGPLVLSSVTALGEVEFRNAIDLNGAVRTITVNDNTSTFTDYATISGVISGSGGISKSGTGLLQLTGQNTYTGATAVIAGQLMVTSLGSTDTPGASSLGDSTNANLAGNALTLGNAGTTAGILDYVGAGETSDRLIRLNTTTGSTQILADGSGALILTNLVNDMALGAKTLYLRGGNTQGNMITSVLANNGGNLAIAVDQGATWILAGNNSYSGNTTVSAGALGVGNDNALGLSTLVLRNGTLFAYGADRTLANTVSVSSTTSAGTFAFIGDYNLTLNGTWNYSNTTVGHVITNGMSSGTKLTLNGDMVLNALTSGSITLTFNGSGDTDFTGDITTTSAVNVNVSYTGDGTLTLSGANTTAGSTTLNNANGTMRLTGAGTLGGGALTVNAGSLFIASVSQSVTTLTMGNVAGTTATIDVASGLTLSATAITFAGTTTLASTITGAGTLALGSAGITVTVADNTTQAADMIWTVDTLTGSGVFTKAGTGVLDISGITHNNFSGAFQINGGAVLGLDSLSNNLMLNGGVYQSSGLFSRALGTGSNQVQWQSLGGGFAASGGDLTVTLSGAPATLVWGGTSSFVPDGAPLLFGSTSADSVTTFTHDMDLNGAVRTVTVTDNTTVTTDQAVLSGVLSNGGITKTGNGILKLGGANTFAGGLTVSAGTLQFSTVSNTGGGPSNLGQSAITLSGGTLSFVGDGSGGSQTTDRTIVVTASSSNLAANGTNGATITYAGNIDLSAMPSSGSLLLTGTGEGFITGGITMTGNSADIQPQSGTWTFSGTPSTLADDFIITGSSVVVNLNTTGVLAWGGGASTSPNFYMRGGAVVNLGADNAITFLAAGGLLLGDLSGVAAENTLNMQGYNLTVPSTLTLGATADVYSGVINGPGTLTIGITIATNRGSISANLAGAGAVQKFGMGTVTFSGDNSGLTSTTAVRLDAGNLILDYSTNNAVKLREATGLDMRGGQLTITGSSSADTVQSVASLTLASGGANRITVTNGTGHSATLNLGAITRANGAGMLRLDLPLSGAITTTTGNSTTTGMLGTTGTAFATITDATGTYFAINDGTGNIVPLTYAAAENDVTLWAAGDNVTDDTTGFAGTVASMTINSLRFDAAGGSTLSLASGAVLNIASGGILVTSNVTATSAISGGRLTADSGELVFTMDAAGQSLNVSSNIGGSLILTKAGDGMLVLSGNNQYAGATNLQGGTLVLSGGNAIGDFSAVTLADDHNNLLQLLASETIGGLVGGSGTAGLDTLAVVDLGTYDLSVNQVASGTYSGRLSGSGRLIKSGAGTLALGGGSTDFTGDVIVNRGQLTLATRTIANLPNVGSVTLNSGTLVLDFTAGSETANKINDSAPVTLINTGGIDGLRANSDRNDAGKTETIGILTFLGGANTVTLQENAAVAASARQVSITAASVVRSNNATLLVRGNNLGDLGSSGVVNSGRLVFTAAPILTGGGGAAGSTTISILPWAIGEAAATATTTYGTGNSFGTYVATTGFRPLDLTNEYEQLGAAGGVTFANNVRYSGATDLVLDGTAKTMNALLVDNSSSSSGITLGGAGASLNVNSGAFLFTGTQGITLSNFSGITAGVPNEYIFHVVNTSPDGVTVAAPLTSGTAALTKSGAGALILTSAGSTYTGATTVNQGVLQIDALNKLGSGGSGGLMLNGGTLRFGGVFDPTSIQVTLGITATNNIQTTVGGTFDTNGFDITLANRLGNGGNGGFTKAGAGVLTLNAVINYGGTTTVTGGTLAYGVNAALPAASSLVLSGGTLDTGSFTTSLASLVISGTSGVTGSAPLTITGNVEADGAVSTRTLAVNNSALTTFSGSLLTLVNAGATARTLTLTGTGDITISSEITNGTAAGNLSYTGSGILTLSGSNTYTGLTTLNNNAGSLVYAGASELSGLALTVNAGTVQLNPAFDQTVGNLTMGGGAAGSTSSLFIGAGKTLTLAGTVTFSSTNNPLVATIDGGVGAILDFGGTARTFTVGDSSNAEPDMIIGANVTLQNDGGGGLIKLGPGTLHIAGTNHLTGPVSIQAGSVTGDLGTGNLLLNNGVYEGNGTFTRSLGSGGGQVQWVAGASGGFAASGGALTVTLASAPDPLIWDSTPFFVSGAGALLFGATTADDVVTFTHSINLNNTASAVTRTITVNDNTDVTTDKAVLTGDLTSSGAGAVTLAKTGSGVLELAGLNTFAALTVSSGTLQFSTISNIGGGPSNLGQGSTISLGAAVLSFIGAADQSTDRTITSTASTTLDASGTAGAIITYTGAITMGTDNSLTLTGTGTGVISGGITQPVGASSADLNVNSGIWTLKDNTVTIADDVIVTGVSTVLNLNTTGVLTAASVSGTSSGLYARTGGTINLNANDVNGAGNSGGLDFIFLGDSGGPQAGILNTNTFNISTPRLDLGQRADSLVGEIDGTGTVTVVGGDINLYDGLVNANLASTGTNPFEKFGIGTVTLKGDNSGLASNANTILYEGTLVLDYTASTATKLRTASALEMLGGSLVLKGNAGTATSQSVASTTLDGSATSDNSGSSSITLIAAPGQNIVLNLGAISRGAAARDGTIRFYLPTGAQTSTNGITTSTVNGTQGLLGTSAYATVDDGTGTWFATNSTNSAGGNIVALVSTVKNNVLTWAVGDHVTDDTTGFTGTLPGMNINSLRFDAAAGSQLNIAQDGVLSIASGGILVTSNVGGTPGILGGTLASGVSELIITQDSAQTFTISSDIRINHAVTKSGTGTLLLTGNNVYNDETEILAGTLQVSGGNAIGDNSIVSLNAYQNTTLQLLDNETIGRLSGGQRATNSDNGTVDVGTYTLTVNEVSSTTYAGLFTGTGNIVKQGEGNLSLTNLSTGFSGAFTVAGGTLQLNGSGQINASSIRVNQDSALLIDNNGTTRSGTRILDTTAVSLNSADGTFSGQTIVRGLAIRTDQAATTNETIGSLNFASGASYLSGETTNSTGTGVSSVIADDFVRSNNATVDVRGRSLGLTSGSRNQFLIGTAANQTAFIATLVGGNGAAGSSNIKIVPWAVGETTSGALTAANMGNSLVTYVSGAGFRPLDFTTEYKTLSAAGTTDNARESLSADLTGINGRTINALVLDNAATATVNVTGSGAGQTLGVTSGALLFTVSGSAPNTAYSTILGGFDGGITVGSTNEYVISVINPNSSNALAGGATTFGSSVVAVTSTAGLQVGSPVFGAGIAPGTTVLSIQDGTHFVMSLPSNLSATGQAYQYATVESLSATISSALTSTADITKSGRGTLILTGVNTAGGGTMKTTLNEGILEISDLDNIGGVSGRLVFAGGTLRLGAGFTDDLSLRDITFLQAGGTIDTNGMDLVLSGSVGSGVGGLTKAGAGNLTLNAAATYTGATTVAGGTLTIGANNATGVGGDLNIAAGATLDTGSFSITAGLVSIYGDSSFLLGSGTITASGVFSFGNTNDITVNTVLAGAGGLLKTQTNTLTLSGLNTFSGPLEVQAGTLSFNSITNVGGAASALGRVTTVQNGVIHMGLGTASTTLSYTGGGSSSDRTIGMQGTTGGVTLDASGTGALTLGGVHFETAGAKTLTLNGTSAPDQINTLGTLDEYGLGVLTLIKSGTNTWVISGVGNYSGATSINDGTLGFTTDQNLAGALNFGSANTITTAGTLDLSGASATFAGNLTVQTNTALETNQLIIGTGKTLTIGGTAVFGSSGSSATTTSFVASGAGTFSVINTTGTGTTFLVGSSGSTNTTTVDFSALATMNVSLNTTSGILQVSSSTSTATAGVASLSLAQDTTLTASALTVGGGGAYNSNAGQINTLKLGTSTNVINVGTVNIGSGSRDLGSITFFNGSGTVTIRAADGTGAAAFNMGTGSGSTSATLPAGNRNTFDVTGHTADLLFGAVNIGTQAARTGALENLFAFDTGTLTTGNLTMGSKTAAGNSTNVINLGGGNVSIGSGTGTAATLASNTSTGAVSSTINVSGGTVTFGSGSGQALILGNSNTNATGSTTTALNVSGGEVMLATTGATAVTLANAASGTANASIGVSSGKLTVQGDIVLGTGGGTRNASVTLNGGTLDMTGRSIGASGGAITFNAQSGTLKNLAELNGGGAFNKTTPGTLYMDGVNSYTGTTTVTAGTLQFVRETALYNNTQASWTDTNLIVSSGATAAFNVGGTGEFTAADVDVIKSLGTASGGFTNGSVLGLDTTNADHGSFTYGGVIADTNSEANSVGLEKMGANTLVLTGTSTYTGPTTVDAGTLQVGDGASGALAGSGTVTVSSSGTLSGSGSIAGSTVISSGAVLAPGAGPTDSSNQTLTFTAAATAVDVKDGGQIQLGLTSSTQIDENFNGTTDALTYLNTHGGATGTAYTTVWNQSGNYDSIKLINGTFNLGTSTPGGTVSVLDNGSSLTLGNIFKLLDWSTVGMLNSLAGTGGFTLADLNLTSVALVPGLSWDTSAFTTYGVIVVVPEASRTLLLMLGLLGLMLRRRRGI